VDPKGFEKKVEIPFSRDLALEHALKAGIQ